MKVQDNIHQQSNNLYRNFILIRFLGYLEYVFLSNSVMIGLAFVVMPIMVISNADALFAQKVASGIIIYSNIFSITTAEKFVNTLIVLFLIVLPLFSFISSLIFEKIHKKFNFGYKLLIIEIVYLFLIIVNVIVFDFYNQEFGLTGFALFTLISIMGLVFYLMSYSCSIFKNTLNKKLSKNKQ